MICRRAGTAFASLALLVSCGSPRPRLDRGAFAVIARHCRLDKPVFIDQPTLPRVTYVDHDARTTMRGRATPKSICLARQLDGYRFAMFTIILDPPPFAAPPPVGGLVPMNATRH